MASGTCVGELAGMVASKTNRVGDTPEQGL